MNELLKKGFFLGLGVAAASKEKVENYVHELVERGKLTPREAEEVVDSFIKKGEETEEKWNQRSKEKVQSILDDLDIVSKQKFSQLEERVRKLEHQLGNAPEEKESTNTDE